jgi:HAD superfamily hydrolase (TIGR01509 family)
MIRAILFDIDGTLVDSNDLHAAAWREAFLHFGVDVPLERVRSQIGKGGDNLIPALLPPELVERRQEEIEDYRSELFQREYLPRAVPFPGVRELLQRLYRDDKKVVLASSAKGAELKFHLELIGARDLVTGTTSKDDVAHSKPCPDIFEAAIAKVAPIDAGEAAVVGDSPWDMKAAGKLGLTCIGLRCGGFDEHLLREAGAAEIYEDPADLLRNYERSLLAR